jgi:hypothetical protein
MQLMKVAWRFLVLMAFLFWQGGFLFYAAVVVPVGQEELGSHTAQGFITRKVTNHLNLAGVVALVFLGADVALPDRVRWRRWLRALAWLALAVLLGCLYWLHGRMDAVLDPEERGVLDPIAFRPYHRVYLWVSTIQWAFGLLYLLLMLGAWRAADRRRITSTPDKELIEDEKTELESRG